MVVAVAVVRMRNLFAAAMLFSIYSLLMAGLFTVLDAGDVALTEAAVGAGISTILMLAALSLTRLDEKPPHGSNWFALPVVIVIGATLIWATLDMPEFGRPDNPIQTHVAPHYIENTYPDMGIPNMVAAILAGYRSFDTLGEAFVILVAGLAVYALLAVRPPRRRKRPEEEGRS